MHIDDKEMEKGNKSSKHDYKVLQNHYKVTRVGVTQKCKYRKNLNVTQKLTLC